MSAIKSIVMFLVLLVVPLLVAIGSYFLAQNLLPSVSVLEFLVIYLGSGFVISLIYRVKEYGTPFAHIKETLSDMSFGPLALIVGFPIDEYVPIPSINK